MKITKLTNLINAIISPFQLTKDVCLSTYAEANVD